MKKVSFLYASILTFLAVHTYGQSGEAIQGTWLNEEKDAKIEIYPSNGKYYGKLIWGEKIFESDGKTSRKDENNPDTQLKNRDLLGLEIIKDFQYKDQEWVDGKIYDPKSGRTYSGTLKLKEGELHLRGYVGISAFGRTTVWTRDN